MQKELTITIDEQAYAFLHQVVGPDKINEFIDSLLKPHVMRDTIATGALDSAEGKALQRIREGVDAVDWIPVSEPGKEIDTDALDEQLRACGYIN